MADRSSPQDPTRDQVAILSGLHQAEISANVGELQTGSSIVLGALAYFAATVLLVRDDDLGFEFLLILPLGVLFLCSYHLLRTAVVVRRANLARHYERELFIALGATAQSEFERGRLGSPYYRELDDVGFLITEKPDGWRVSAIVASFSYFGLYALAVIYTVLVLREAWQRSESVTPVVLTGLCYAVLFLIYTAFAVTALLRRQPALVSFGGPAPDLPSPSTSEFLDP